MTIQNSKVDRFTVDKVVRFGMIFGYEIYDNLEKKRTGYECDCEDKWLMDSKCELLNLLK